MYEAVDNIGIAVEDVDEALEFYGTLGFEVERYSEMDGRVEPSESGAYLYVFETSEGSGEERNADLFTNPTGIDHVSIEVEDVDRVYDRLTDRGVEFFVEPTTEEDWGLRMAGVRDPSGNVLYFVRYL